MLYGRLRILGRRPSNLCPIIDAVIWETHFRPRVTCGWRASDSFQNAERRAAVPYPPLTADVRWILHTDPNDLNSLIK